MNVRVGNAVLIAVALIAVTGCTGNLDTALERLSQARMLSSDLLVQFTKSAESSGRAAMAATEDASRDSARESENAMRAVQQDVESLRPLLDALEYSAERQMLAEFGRQFGEYRTLNEKILALATESTNVKAQRLSFGEGQAAADAFREALEPVKRAVAGPDRWHVEALVATAIGSVREIQAVQGPHIAEPTDTAMTQMETRMAAAERTARGALNVLAGLVPLESRPHLTTAMATLDRFMAVNAEVVVLSRRNSNVQSLALSFGQKRVLTAQGEATLRLLQDALANRRFGGTR